MTNENPLRVTARRIIVRNAEIHLNDIRKRFYKLYPLQVFDLPPNHPEMIDIVVDEEAQMRFIKASMGNTEELNGFEGSLTAGIRYIASVLRFTDDLDGLTDDGLARRLEHSIDALKGVLTLLELAERNASRAEIRRVLTQQMKSEFARRGADARHKRHRETGDRIRAWYWDNHSRFTSMDGAAEAISKIEHVSFRTAREHIGTAAKEMRSARKA